MTKPRRTGFTLIEVLAAMIVLATFAVIASRLYVTTFQTLGRTRDAHNMAAHARHIERRLQSDAWNAERIACPQPDRVEIDLPGDRSVVWLCTQNESAVDLQRRLLVDGRAIVTDTFAGFGEGTRFDTDGMTLRLTRGDVELTCASELQWLRRAER